MKSCKKEKNNESLLIISNKEKNNIHSEKNKIKINIINNIKILIKEQKYNKKSQLMNLNELNRIENNTILKTDKKLKNDIIIKILTYLYYNYKIIKNNLINKKIKKKMLFSVLNEKKKKIINYKAINEYDLNISNKLAFSSSKKCYHCNNEIDNAKILNNLYDIYAYLNIGFLKLELFLKFDRDKYFEFLKRKKNENNFFLFVMKKEKFMLFIYLLKIVKKKERLKLLLNYF